MARWQRDPKARRRMAHLLVAAEVLALAACFYGVFSAYLLRGLLALGVGQDTAYTATWVGGIGGTVLCLAAAVLVGRKYLAGYRGARTVFLVANGVLVVLGLVWFGVHYARAGAAADSKIALLGLLLPMITLFPLLWPLLTFRPTAPETPAGP